MHTPLVDPGPDPHPYGAVLGMIELLERRQRGADATRLMLIAAALDRVLDGAESGTSREIAYRSLRAELATALSQSEHIVEQQMDLAHRLTREYEAVYEALDRGEISCAHARVIADAGIVIGSGDESAVAERRSGYARDALEIAVRETPNRLRPCARALAEAWAGRSIDERHRDARARRRVMLIDREDGMSDLIAHLPAAEAHAAHDRITRIAAACERGERAVPGSGAGGGAGDGAGDSGSAGSGAGHDRDRTRDELRADVLADLLLAADEHALFAGDSAEAIRARVQIVVPVSAIALTGGEGDGSGDAACELVGYGPIDSGTARHLTGAAPGWSRVLADASTGSVLSVDRYRPSEQMRRTLAARDRHCRFPGCRVPASRCDLDHTVPAARGGPTATGNLAHLCRGHHTLKHHSGWHVAQESDGVLRWTSPAGRKHLDRPRRPGQSPPRGSPEGTRLPVVRAARTVRFERGDDSVAVF